MKGFFKGFGQLLAAGLFGALLVNAGPGFSSAISLLTGPQPAADLVSIVNGLITNINTKVSPTGPGNVSDSVYVPTCSGCFNWVSLSGGASLATPASNVVSIASFGPKTSVSIGISPQGAEGRLRFQNPSNVLLSSGGSVPSGQGNAIRSWIAIELPDGVSRLIPAYGYTAGP